MWTEYFDRIVCINLPERFDRWYDVTEVFKEYEIEVERYEATKHTEGYRGLILTMKALFRDCLDKGYERILVFEDDVYFTEPKEVLNQTMSDCVEWLSENDWGTFHLGLQHVRLFDKLIAPHVLRVNCGYSTHAIAYNKHFMESFINNYIDEPCDNWAVREYQPFGKSFCAYPLLATQRAGYSNIENNHIDWNRHISETYNMATKNILG